VSWIVRPARASDLDALVALAQLTGIGFTNIPQDAQSMAKRLDWSARSFARAGETPADDLYLLVLENRRNGELGGTALLYGMVGQRWPFYSYLLSEYAQHSETLGRTIRAELLNLVTDNGGASEVGGLFLRPDLRTGGLGRLLARSRYMFIAQHRARFTNRMVSELRGWHTPEGDSPFWDAVGAKFFGMSFVEADTMNTRSGNQFIAELMPKQPIYTAMLPESARAVIGKPNEAGVGAMKLLEREGFSFDGYVDIFDAGPTMNARTDHIATVRESRVAPVVALGEAAGVTICAAGRLDDFRAWLGPVDREGEGWQLPAASPVGVGEEVRVAL
jgi:arginine N-succinyltransferase